MRSKLCNYRVSRIAWITYSFLKTAFAQFSTPVTFYSVSAKLVLSEHSLFMKNTCKFNISIAENTAKQLASFCIESDAKRSEVIDKAIRLYLHEIGNIGNGIAV